MSTTFIVIVFVLGAIFGPMLLALLVNLLMALRVKWWGLAVCWGWYTLRKQQGHPITLRRAFFQARPQFGLYEYEEAGCPDWDRKAYQTVRGIKHED